MFTVERAGPERPDSAKTTRTSSSTRRCPARAPSRTSGSTPTPARSGGPASTWARSGSSSARAAFGPPPAPPPTARRRPRRPDRRWPMTPAPADAAWAACPASRSATTSSPPLAAASDSPAERMAIAMLSRQGKDRAGHHPDGRPRGGPHARPAPQLQGVADAPLEPVMEYMSVEGKAASPRPGPYDIAAIRYLYNLAEALPTEPFCTDGQNLADPLCTQRDFGADPLNDFHSPRLRRRARRLSGHGAGPRSHPARDGSHQPDVLRARRHHPRAAPGRLAHRHRAGARRRCPCRCSRRASIWSPARSWPGSSPIRPPPAARGATAPRPPPACSWAPFPADPKLSDGGGPRAQGQRAGHRAAAHAHHPADQRHRLKRMQTLEAYRALREARAQLAQAQPRSRGDEQLMVEDLVTRIDEALTPYFDWNRARARARQPLAAVS